MSLRKNVKRDAAGRTRADRIDRVVAAAGTAWPRLDVRRGEVCLEHSCASVLLIIHCPLLFARVDLLQVCNASVLAAALSCLDKVRNCDRHQNSNNQDHDHDFNKGKSSFLRYVHLV